jgi:hypothetical protein
VTCIDTPISWLRLEQFVLDGRDAKIASHVEACPACAQCLESIKRDSIELPALAKTSPTDFLARRPWWHFAVPAVALAAAIVVFLVWPRDRAREDRVTVKGVGDVVLGVVRERDGNVLDDASTFRETDRWKVVLTCPPSASAWVEVDVSGDHPLAPAQIACGNRVIVPGAFHITGAAANRICVRVSASEGADPGRACVTIRPEE